MSPPPLAADALHRSRHVFADLGLDRFHLAGGEAAGHELPELGVHGRVLHDHRRIVGEPDEVQFAVVDRQALRRREGPVVARGGEDVGVPRQHVVVVLGLVIRDDVVDRVVIAQRAVHRPGVTPGGGVGELELHRRVLRQNRDHVLWVRQYSIDVNHTGRVAGNRLIPPSTLSVVNLRVGFLKCRTMSNPT